jgi:hypothetical protein
MIQDLHQILANELPVFKDAHLRCKRGPVPTENFVLLDDKGLT